DQRLKTFVRHIGGLRSIERKAVLRKILVLNKVLHFFQSGWAYFIFELVFKNVELIAEMVNRNHIPIYMVLQMGNIPVWVGRTYQLDVLKMRNRIKSEKSEKSVGNKPEIQIIRFLK